MQAFPLNFAYDQHTQQLQVEFADGSFVRYYDIEPKLAFLSPTNGHRNRDFLDYLQYRIQLRDPIKSEVIQKPTKTIGEPQTKPPVALEQSQHGRKPAVRIQAPWFK
jgi:hypothetical protein